MLREIIEYWRERWELRRRIAEELRFHTDEAIDENLSAGMTREEAEYSARTRLGNRLFITQQCLVAAGMDDLRSKVAPARIPAAAWGAAAAVVPMLLAALLIPHHFRPLPVVAPHQLAVSDRSLEKAFAIAKEFPRQAATFRPLVATIGAPEMGRAFVGRAVSPNFFAVQNAEPVLGAGFGDCHDSELMVSHRLWEEFLGRDASVIGRRLEVNGVPYRVAGVMPEAYWFLHRVDRFWLCSPSRRSIRSRAALLVSRVEDESGTGLMDELADAKIELVPLEQASRRPVQAAGGIAGAALLLLALVGLLQTASLLRVVGDPAGPRQQIRFGLLARNYAFLFAKALPVLAIGSILWIASVEGELLSPASYFGEVSTIMGTFVFALSAVAAAWYSLVDQRLRCPMCLRKLSMPVPLGIIGSILFDLPGTEYICTYGHGTLYMPEPTSEGLRAPRWKEPVGVWAEILGSSPARLG